MKQTIKAAVFQQIPNINVDMVAFNTIIDLTTNEILHRMATGVVNRGLFPGVTVEEIKQETLEKLQNETSSIL